MNWREFITGNRGKVLPNELKGFNWGAFLLTFIWGIRFRAWITLIAVPLIWFQLPLGLNWILFTILQIYCGIKGNEWAYQVDWWKTPRDFQNTQIKWAAAAVALSIIVPVAVLGIAARFVQKSADNPLKLVENAQCTVSYSKIKHGLPKITLSTGSISQSELANQFASNFKNTKVEGNTVTFTMNDSGNQLALYSITFSKMGSNLCSISEKNCIITTSYTMPQNVMGTRDCIFYFDSQGKIEPDEATKNALDMGLNIFKYL